MYCLLCITFLFFILHHYLSQDQAMVGYEMVKTIGNAVATYKFTPKFVLKAGQKVTVRVCPLDSNPLQPFKEFTNWCNGDPHLTLNINYK